MRLSEISAHYNGEAKTKISLFYRLLHHAIKLRRRMRQLLVLFVIAALPRPASMLANGWAF